ncbi:GNAT family N-acetyltransferase [Phytomonospora sp. NPDC050363]|uniref:GNAT family N-acetyltransferase n=1 Tax=Phytomonospora sp. NPDC050363 TaxID=3155642 RepID=UPI0033FF2328
MPEIRRITEAEADPVAELWDRMCREIPDGGPLDEAARTRISRMLAAGAWHHSAFCLVAVHDSRPLGFVNGRVDPGDGLLPGLVGEIDSLWVAPEIRAAGVGAALSAAAVALLRDRGVWTVRTLVCAGNDEAAAFWRGAGFEADMTCFSLYRDEA